MASMRDVAKLANVGLGTVSRMLNDSGYVSDETRSRIEAAMKTLDYTPNELARNLYHKRTGIIAVLVPNASNPFFAEFVDHVESELYKAGFKMMLCTTEKEFNAELEYLDMLKICTDITGDQEAYETYGTQVREEVEAVLASVPETGEAEQKRILFIRAGSKYSATKAKTAENNFVCVMLKELGTYNIAENAPVLLDGLSQEEILMENPDYIFISTMGKEEAARAYMDSVLQEEAWQHLDAVKEGRYAYLPKELFQFKPNKRWGEAYRYLADLLYPKES